MKARMFMIRRSEFHLPYHLFILLLATGAGLACLLQLKDPLAADAFLGMLLPLIGLCCLSLLLGAALGSDLEFHMAAAILLLLGAALQCLLDPDYGPMLVRIWWAAGICGGICLAGWLLGGRRLCRQQPGLVLILLAGINLLVFAALFLFGAEIGGTKAWLSVGSGSIQLTELIKLTAVFYYGLLCAQEGWSWSRRFLLAWSYLLFNAGSLLLLNELGTLMLLLALHMVLCSLFFPLRCTGLNIGVTAGLGALGMLLLDVCSSLAERGMAAGTKLFSLLEKASAIQEKLLLRFSLLRDLETLDPYGSAYQGIQARNAVLLGGAFGSDGTAYVPVAESDFVFIYLVNRLGLVFGLLTLVLFTWLFAAGIRQYLAVEDRLEQAVAAAAVCSIFLQFLVMLFGSTGFFLLTGVPIPFLSRAGTYSVVLGVLLAFLLYGGRRRELFWHDGACWGKTKGGC